MKETPEQFERRMLGNWAPAPVSKPDEKSSLRNMPEEKRKELSIDALRQAELRRGKRI